MTGDQKEIYYLVGPSREAIEAGPYLEGFRARNLEVLFCYEAVDEYVMNNVREFEGKKLVAADHADVKLPTCPSPPEGALGEAETKELVDWLKETLGDRVAEVKASTRLVDSPALALNADKAMSPHMRRMMKAMHKECGRLAAAGQPGDQPPARGDQAPRRDRGRRRPKRQNSSPSRSWTTP